MKAPEDKFYAISNKGKIDEFKELELAYNSKPRFVLSENISYKGNGSFLNTYFEYELYDGQAKDTKVNISNWHISEFHTKMDVYHKTTLSMKIEDPNGIIETKEFKNFHVNIERLIDLLFI